MQCSVCESFLHKRARGQFQFRKRCSRSAVLATCVMSQFSCSVLDAGRSDKLLDRFRPPELLFFWHRHYLQSTSDRFAILESTFCLEAYAEVKCPSIHVRYGVESYLQETFRNTRPIGLHC
jgi:hypothetical protein